MCRSWVKVSNNYAHPDIKALNQESINVNKRYKSSGIESEDERKARLNASSGHCSVKVWYRNLNETGTQIAEPTST